MSTVGHRIAHTVPIIVYQALSDLWTAVRSRSGRGRLGKHILPWSAALAQAKQVWSCACSRSSWEGSVKHFFKS